MKLCRFSYSAVLNERKARVKPFPRGTSFGAVSDRYRLTTGLTHSVSTMALMSRCEIRRHSTGAFSKDLCCGAASFSLCGGSWCNVVIRLSGSLFADKSFIDPLGNGIVSQMVATDPEVKPTLIGRAPV